MTIGQRIRARREFLGMTQDELAKKLGYANRSSVNKVESSRELSNKKVALYASALGTSISYLMGWEEEEKNTFEIEYDPQHLEMIELFSKLTKEQKQMVMNMLRSFVE